MSKFTDHVKRGEELLKEADEQPYVDRRGTLATLAIGHFPAAFLEMSNSPGKRMQ